MTAPLLVHAEALSAIHTAQDAAIAKDVAGMFASFDGHPHFPSALHEAMPEILDQHAQAAGLITAQWYEELDPASKFRAKPFTDIPREQIDKTVDWALYAPGEEPPVSRLTGSSQRMVRNVSRQTVTRNAADEGVRWARYAQPSACAFCRTLAMRGSGREDQKWLYHSEKSAEYRKSDGEKYHTHCFCEAVAVRGNAVWTPPDYTQGWDQEYIDATKRVKKGKDYFKRLVADIRSNEPKTEEPQQEPEPAVPEVPDILEPQVPEVPEMTEEEKLAEEQRLFEEEKARQAQAAKDELRARIANDINAEDDLPTLQHIARQLLPDTTVSLRDQDGEYPPFTSGQAVRATIRAVDHVLTKYPETKLDGLGFENEGDDSTYASTTNRPRLQRITANMNRAWIPYPDGFNERWQANVDSRFHFPGVPDDPAYNVMMHEMGHVIAFTATQNGARTINATAGLLDHYIATRGTPGTRVSFTDFQQWMRDNVSGYSFMKGSDTVLDDDEALAEAFADVEVNGDDAAETSKVLHALLIGALASNRNQQQAAAA